MIDKSKETAIETLDDDIKSSWIFAKKFLLNSNGFPLVSTEQNIATKLWL